MKLYLSGLSLTCFAVSLWLFFDADWDLKVIAFFLSGFNFRWFVKWLREGLS